MRLISHKFASHSSCCLNSYFSHLPRITSPTLPFSAHPISYLNSPHSQTLPASTNSPVFKIPNSLHSNHGPLRVHHSNGGVTDVDGVGVSNFDAFLSFAELAFVASSLALSVGCVLNSVFFRQQYTNLVAFGSRVLVWLLAGAVAVGTTIRRRQCGRVGGLQVTPGVQGGNVVDRIQILEENLRSATTVVRMLSRQLEKLGTRFRLMKRALKDPVHQTAASVQKNSEATRALALQADTLEKELVEVQKVLLAMQDQQQKQLKLIISIAKAGKLFEANQGSDARVADKWTDARVPQADAPILGTVAGEKGSNNKP